MPVLYVVMFFDLNDEDGNCSRREFYYSKKQVVERHEELKKEKESNDDFMYDGYIYQFRYTNVINLVRELELLNDPEKCNKLTYIATYKF